MAMVYPRLSEQMAHLKQDGQDQDGREGDPGSVSQQRKIMRQTSMNDNSSGRAQESTEEAASTQWSKTPEIRGNSYMYLFSQS